MAYPLPKFHFLVKWDPGVRAGFTEVTGLDMQIEAIEYREGSSPEYSKIKMLASSHREKDHRGSSVVFRCAAAFAEAARTVANPAAGAESPLRGHHS